MAEIAKSTVTLAGLRAYWRAALRIAFLMGASTFACGSVQAQPATSDAAPVAAHPQDWSSLTPSQQQALAPLHDQWSRLLPGQQQRFLRIAARWQDAAPPKRAAIEQRIAGWVAMTPEQRAALRTRYKKFHELPPDEQQDLRDAFQHFRDLPPDQRQALRERFDRMSPAERDAMLAKAASEPSHPVWPRVFADVPGEQRAAMRALWLGLDREQRHALRRHVQSLPLDDRAALRTRLLAMTPAQRVEFIATLPHDPQPSP